MTKKTKKYQLHGSYFKSNRMLNLPETILEIAEYEKANGELPFAYSGSNWVYDAFCERQKYRGVNRSQFLTPDDTAYRMTQLARTYFPDKYAVVPCCGTGQISKELHKAGYSVKAFDIDYDLVTLCSQLYPDVTVFHSDFNDCCIDANQIVTNPPYEHPVLTEFLEWIDRVQDSGGLSILLLPKGFINKLRPKRTYNAVCKFEILETRDMTEEFVRTKTRAEIVVLKKLQ